MKELSLVELEVLEKIMKQATPAELKFKLVANEEKQGVLYLQYADGREVGLFFTDSVTQDDPWFNHMEQDLTALMVAYNYFLPVLTNYLNLVTAAQKAMRVKVAEQRVLLGELELEHGA